MGEAATKPVGASCGDGYTQMVQLGTCALRRATAELWTGTAGHKIALPSPHFTLASPARRGRRSHDGVGHMRLASLERMGIGLQQAPHEYRASLQSFPDVSVDALARDLKVVERAKENGKVELPSSSSSKLDETEYAIIERIFSDRKAAHQTLTDQLETYAQRRTALDFHGRFTVIQHAAPAAVAEFRTEANLGRDQLHQLRRALVENEQERDHFREQHRLRRVPRVSSPATNFLKLTLLAFLFVSETYINGVFLAKGNALGFIGGVAEAMVFAVLNVLISFGIGLGGLRELNHRRLFRKLLGLLSFIAWMVFAVFLNLALAHYREVSGVLLDDAGAQVITRLWQSPAALSDIKSWLFFGIGLVWSAIALIDGIFYTDPYPGYADVAGDHRRRAAGAC
jgi:hypothetical protein